MESHWSQSYWMEHQWIQCFNEWNPTEVNVVKSDINEFNALINGIPLKAKLSNGTSMNSML